MDFKRRQLLQALGLGALMRVLPRRAFAEDATSPSRVVFFVQPHGHVPNAWNMPIPGSPTTAFAARPLADVSLDDLSTVLKPLYAYRDRLLVAEGLSHTTALWDIAEVTRKGSGDLNNHNVAIAGLLSGTRALQRRGLPCTGAARTIDQELALRSAGTGRFDSRVYGADYVVNSATQPFSFLGSGQRTPIVTDPATAFADLLGYANRPAIVKPKTRDEELLALRSSVLDTVAREYDAVSKQLSASGRLKLEAHRDLVRELEKSVSAKVASPAACDPKFDDSGDKISQFMRIIALALSCDLTRVVTYVAPVPQCPEFGYPAKATVHGTYAHASIKGQTSCGQLYTPIAAQAMTDLGAWYAKHFALLLQSLDAIGEGSGTLLDHTAVVWVTELGTPTHRHEDVFTLIAGGCNGFFNTGRYVRYPRTAINPIQDFPRVGPAHNRLFVSLLRAMGQTDDSFGLREVKGADGSTLNLTGPLTELHSG